MPVLSHLYATYGTAVRVVNDLEAAGVAADAIALVSGEKGAGARAGMPGSEKRAYAESIRQGGTLVSVRAGDAEVSRIEAILRLRATVEEPEAGAALDSSPDVPKGGREADERPDAHADAVAGVSHGTASRGAFQERVYEVRATGEEADISKEVRIYEEIVIRKDAADRVQVVRETVRETKAEIEDSTTRP